MHHDLFRDASFWTFLLEVRGLAKCARQQGCSCGGRLHCANYPRKPRYSHKEEPSFGDMLTTLRRLSWKNNFGDVVPKRGRAKDIFDQITWILC